MNGNNRLVKELKERGLTLGFAESMTCGLAAHKLASFQGTSDVLLGAIVCYTPEIKQKLLGVSKAMINRFSAESMEVTAVLAKNLRREIPADICAAVTGLASPGGSETKEKPVGTVFFCVSFQRKIFRERKVFRGTPLEIRNKACDFMYRFILNTVRHEENS